MKKNLVKNLTLLILVFSSSVLLSSDSSSSSSCYTKHPNHTYQEYCNKVTEQKNRIIIAVLYKKGHPLNVIGLPQIIANYIFSPISYDLWIENGKKLIKAAKDGDEKIVKELLDSGEVDVNVKDIYGFTALMHAAFLANENLVKLLLDYGIDVNIKSNNGSTALIEACKRGNLYIVKLLLDHKAYVDTQDQDGYCAMKAASIHKNQIILILLKNHAKQDKCSIL